MTSMNSVDGAVLVGLVGLLVSGYLALDKRLRRVEGRGRTLSHRIDVLEGNQNQVASKQKGLSRKWTILFAVAVVLFAGALAVLLYWS